jgi:hypothetical protein
MTLDAVEFIRRFLPSGFVTIRHSRRQALALCRIHLSASTHDVNALRTELQKSALNRSCPQCKRGTLHVVAHLLADGRPTPAHRLPATTSTHPEARRCRPTCQPDSSPRRTLTPPTLPHASNRLRTTLRFVAAIPCTPPAHHRTSLLWSPSSDFVPRQPHQLPANSIQSPYIHRANGLLQIAVSTLLPTGSIGAREVLAAEYCRYGTRDFDNS